MSAVETTSLHNVGIDYWHVFCRSLYLTSAQASFFHKPHTSLSLPWCVTTTGTYSYNGGSRLSGTCSASAPWGSPCLAPPSCGEVKTVCHTASTGAPRRWSTLTFTISPLCNNTYCRWLDWCLLPNRRPLHVQPVRTDFYNVSYLR